MAFWVVGVSGGNGGGGGGVDTGLLGGRGGGGGGGGTDCSVAPFSELWAGLSVGSSNNAEPWLQRRRTRHKESCYKVNYILVTVLTNI